MAFTALRLEYGWKSAPIDHNGLNNFKANNHRLEDEVGSLLN